MTTETETQANSTGKFTLREAIEASFKEHSAPDEEPPKQAGAEETAEIEETETVETEVEAQTDETEVKEPTEAPPDAEEAEVEVVLAPDDWSDEWKSEFGKLDDAGKELALTQYKSFQSDYTKKLEPVTAINKVLEPYREQIALQGGTPEQLVARLLEANAYITQRPTEGIATLIQRMGGRVNLQELAKSLGLAQAETSDDDEILDPHTKALKQELSELKNQLAGNEQTQQQATQQQGLKMIQDFKDEKDGDGNPKHPHFDTVTTTFAAILKADPSISMEDAYDQAVWANPLLRKEVLESQRKEEKAKADEKAKAAKAKKVTEAKKAATKLPGKKAGSAEEEAPKTLSDHIKSAIKVHSAG